jgi:hypothetical protein
MYFIGINVPFNCSMEDPVEDYILKEKLDNDRDLWDEQCWGFYDEIDLKLFREDLFLNVDEDGIQTNIKSDNKFKKEFIDLSLSIGYNFIYFDKDFNKISKDAFIKLTKSSTELTLSICQCSPD